MTSSTCLFPIFFLYICRFVSFFNIVPFEKRRKEKGEFSARGTDGPRARFRESLGWWRTHGPEPNHYFNLLHSQTIFKKYPCLIITYLIDVSKRKIASPLILSSRIVILFFKKKVKLSRVYYIYISLNSESILPFHIVFLSFSETRKNKRLHRATETEEKKRKRKRKNKKFREREREGERRITGENCFVFATGIHIQQARYLTPSKEEGRGEGEKALSKSGRCHGARDGREREREREREEGRRGTRPHSFLGLLTFQRTLLPDSKALGKA